MGRPAASFLSVLIIATAVVGAQGRPAYSATPTFDVVEASIEDVQNDYRRGDLTSLQLVRMYLDRIEAYDRRGPTLTSIIKINPNAMEDAARLDSEYRDSGRLSGPLHGVPILIKDQIDVSGLPTTLGSVLMKDYVPTRDAHVVVRLRKAGAIILAKTTLGELGAGDSYGTLFGATRNPYDPDRTAGGSSGGSGAALAANLGMVAVGQEFYASIRRPAAWNSVVAMRPSPGLVSRSGAWDGLPSPVGQLGPMGRTVTDMAKLLDAMVGYDAEDPLTALGRGHIPDSYTRFLDAAGLRGARIGVLRAPMGEGSEPDSADFKQVGAVFEAAVGDLRAAGATVIEIEIPDLAAALAKRALNPDEDGSVAYFARNPRSPYRRRSEFTSHPEYNNIVGVRRAKYRSDGLPGSSRERYSEYEKARERLMAAFKKIVADQDLDAIVHKTMEHTPTLIRDGVAPPYLNQRGATHLNTYLIHTSAISVPAGFTSEGRPVGITFLGPAFSEPTLIRLAYAYELATRHRIPPSLTPALPVSP